MTNLAVYSVLVGPTGVGPAPVPPSNSYDLVLFTDDPDMTAEHWDVRLIDTHGLDSARAAKRAKILAHRYLPDHDWSLFLDTGIALEADPVDMLERYAGSGPSFFSFRHRDRMCLYEEAEAVIERGEEDERRVREQADHYRRLGFPRRFGLIAGALLLRRHNDRAVMEVAEDWYEHLLRYSAREELAFAFAAWRHGFEPGRFDGDIADNACIAPLPRSARGRTGGRFDPAAYRWLHRSKEDRTARPENSHGTDPDLFPAPGTQDWALRKRANRYRCDKGTLYYSANGYADIYELFLRDRRMEPLRLLEMGLLRTDIQERNPGGPHASVPSLAMWRDYLPNATIYGFDISDFSAAPAMPGVHILRGNSGRLEDLDRLIAQSGGLFDVIVDDASHASHHQQIALARLFPRLRPGGLYCIENLHHQPAGIEPGNAVRTLDLLRALACGRGRETPHLDRHALAEIKAAIADIAFYDSLDRSFGEIHRDALAILRRR